MADDYADNLAESYIRKNDSTGDTMGENFNGGVVAMPLAEGEVREPISGEVRDTVTDENRPPKSEETGSIAAPSPTGNTSERPKWRTPTEKELARTMGTLDATVGGVGAAIGGNGLGAFIAAPGIATYYYNRPDIEEHFRSKATEPVFENWDENDYQNYYRNWG